MPSEDDMANWAIYPGMPVDEEAAIRQYWAQYGMQPPVLPSATTTRPAQPPPEPMEAAEYGPTPTTMPAPQPTTRPARQPTTRPSPDTQPAFVPMTDVHMQSEGGRGRFLLPGEANRAAETAATVKGGKPLANRGMPQAKVATTQPSNPPEPAVTGAPKRTTRTIKDDMHGATPQQYAAYKRLGFVWIPNPGRPPKGVEQNRWGHWGKAK